MRLRSKAYLLCAAASLAGLLCACGASAPEPRGALHYAEDAKIAYDKAMVAFNAHDWEDARALFKEVQRKYSYSRYARLAELRLADTDYGSEKLGESIQEYKSFVHDHRLDAEVPYARFRICKGLFDQISEGGFLLPPIEERDQGTTTDAHRELSSFVKDYPVGVYSAQARYMLTIITARLVRHELYVAKYYLGRDQYPAAVARAEYALQTYQGSGLEPETIVLLGETYLKMHRPNEARTTFNELLAKYPTSAFSVTAKQFIVEMDRQAK